MKPLVSVIVPVFNTGDHLKTCLDSIVNQTYDNLEIIIINDGSTDRSPEICDYYTINDNRITVIHRDNQGVSSARNAGMEKARGDYISFVDSDDWLELNAYEHLVECALNHGVDAVIFEYFVDYKDGKTNHKNHYELNGLMSRAEAIEMTISPVSRFVWAKLYAKKLISDLKFEQNIHIGEDTLFACYALNNADSVYYTAKPLYHYVQSDVSATRSAFNKKRFTGVVAYKKLVELCQDHYPDLVGAALSSYINLIISVVIDLYNNSDYPNSKIIRKDLTAEVGKYCSQILLAKKVKTRAKLKVFWFFLSPRLSYLAHKRHRILNFSRGS